MICVKTHRVLISLLEHAYHPTLVELVVWFLARYSDTCITSGSREGDKGVHGTLPCRAMDMRSRMLENAQAVADDINANWAYDPDRPEKLCCVYHAVCPKCKESNLAPRVAACRRCGADITNHWHLHLQVHFNTNLRKGERQ